MAFLNALLRPFPGEHGSLLIAASSAENLLVLGAVLFCLVFSSYGPADKTVLWFCVFFVIMLYTLTGLTTPVTGAIVRYRVPAVPFLLIGALTLLDKWKAARKIPFLRKFLS
jgi:hypothetical protein